jgi:hypothetical protein
MISVRSSVNVRFGRLHNRLGTLGLRTIAREWLCSAQGFAIVESSVPAGPGCDVNDYLI